MFRSFTSRHRNSQMDSENPNKLNKLFLSDLMENSSNGLGSSMVSSESKHSSSSQAKKRIKYTPSYHKTRKSHGPPLLSFDPLTEDSILSERRSMNSIATPKRENQPFIQRLSPSANPTSSFVFAPHDYAPSKTGNKPFGVSIHSNPTSFEKIDVSPIVYRTPMCSPFPQEGKRPQNFSFVSTNQSSFQLNETTISEKKYSLASSSFVDSFSYQPVPHTKSQDFSKMTSLKKNWQVSSDVVPESPTKAVYRSRKPSIRDFEVIKHIGRGSYADVYIVKSLIDGKIYAMKKIDKNFIEKQGKNHQVFVERVILDKFNHRGIVKLYTTFQTANSLCSILEFIEGGEFSDHIKANISTTFPPL